MDYISIKQAAKIWGIDTSRIGILAREGRIKGAIIVGRNWLIPSDAQKPIDLRKSKKTKNDENISFHFPIFVSLPKDKFYPPLSNDELTLRNGEIHFYKCDFEKAQNIFIKLCNNSKNIYVRICSAFFMCLITACSNTLESWNEYYQKFILFYEDDFKYKTEMELLKPLLYSYLGMYDKASSELSLKQDYKYHKLSYYTYSYLSFYHLINEKSLELDLKNFEIYEILCQQMEEDGHMLEAQSLHRLLFVSYLLIQNSEQMMHHLKRVISIAKEYDLIYIAAEFAPYYESYYDLVLKEYPKEFANKIYEIGKSIFDSFTLFNKKYTSSKLYSELNEKDYQIVLYKLQGYLNKQIATKMNLSERTVANRLSSIYDKLGIKNKSELTNILNNSL